VRVATAPVQPVKFLAVVWMVKPFVEASYPVAKMIALATSFISHPGLLAPRRVVMFEPLPYWIA
jgi:hypothetical protein